MSFSFGWNFRLDSTYTTDSQDETYVQLRSQGSSQVTDTYPTVRNGQTFGYDAFDSVSSQSANDSQTIDHRLAGYHLQSNNGTQARFVVQLPAAGVYDLHLAGGNTIFAQPAMNFDIYDDQTIIASLYLPSGIGGGLYVDAVNGQYNAQGWPLLEHPLRLTFASTLFRIRYGLSQSQLNGTNQGTTTLNHLRLTQISVANRTYIGAGGVSFFGTAPKQLVLVTSGTKVYLPTGGVLFAGAANTVSTAPIARLPRATTVPWQDQMTTKGWTV